ncbi:MAG: hypothetical protein WBA54_14685 [Acidaminobacteraceae bacterium]
MSKCKICEKDIRTKNDLFVIANGLFAIPKPYHKKCYLSKSNENKIKKKHRLINSEAMYISIVIQLVFVAVFGVILFKSEPDSIYTMIAFPMALLMVVIIAELIQKVYSAIMFERKI